MPLPRAPPVRRVPVLDRVERRAGTGLRCLHRTHAARFEPADLSVPAQVTTLAERAGQADILVNNAGIFHFARTADTTPASFDAHIAINLRAPYLLVQALAPGMTERGHGAIINVSSGAADTPSPGSGI